MLILTHNIFQPFESYLIYRARRKNLPTNPTCMGEVHDVINFLKPLTSKNEDFLMFNDINSNIIIFSCKTNLSFLCRSETIYVDVPFHTDQYFFYNYSPFMDL